MFKKTYYQMTPFNTNKREQYYKVVILFSIKFIFIEAVISTASCTGRAPTQTLACDTYPIR